MMSSRSRAFWQKKAERRLQYILGQIQKQRGLIPRGEKPALWTAEIRLVGQVRMRQLNGAYRGKTHATDVLSFPAPKIFRKQGVLGELIICWPTLQKQSKLYRHSVSVELDVLLIHGLLHLLGWDHESSSREAVRMARLEKQILGQLQRGDLGLIDRANSGISVG